MSYNNQDLCLYMQISNPYKTINLSIILQKKFLIFQKQDLYIPLTSTDFLSLSDFLLSYILLGDRLSGSLLEELLVDPLFFGVAKINE